MIRKVLLVGLVVAFTAIAGFSYAQDVVVTQNGSKYHKPSCSLIKNKENIRTMDKKAAEEAGYTPCKRCFKDEISDGSIDSDNLDKSKTK